MKVASRRDFMDVHESGFKKRFYFGVE